jgi:omega-6 fatty acid desaturase (delta-12 desaturase)
MLLLSNRLPIARTKRKERMSVRFTLLLLFLAALAANEVIGWRIYPWILLPVLWLAGAAGIWLLYAPHQFEGGYWARKREWEPMRAAMGGGSFYDLAPLLGWFSGSIGYHHVHHLSIRIPNYHLENCCQAVPALQSKTPLTLAASFLRTIENMG